LKFDRVCAIRQAIPELFVLLTLRTVYLRCSCS
jgi:hypothetical protein